MNDPCDEQLNKLFAAARQAAPDTSRTEFGFETRLLARLRAARPEQPWFAVALRLLPVFAAIVVALGVWNFIGEPVDIDQTLGTPADANLLVNVLTGDTK